MLRPLAATTRTQTTIAPPIGTFRKTALSRDVSKKPSTLQTDVANGQTRLSSEGEEKRGGEGGRGEGNCLARCTHHSAGKGGIIKPNDQDVKGTRGTQFRWPAPRMAGHAWFDARVDVCAAHVQHHKSVITTLNDKKGTSLQERQA